MAYEFDGAPYEKRANMLATRHARYPGLDWQRCVGQFLRGRVPVR
ncbi:hypothetical protein LMG10733_1452 [Bifidobacterium adolescentis]|nr:hypothetical protein LMG10733_1452 [Bifidobacterium adolescentis]SPU22879.1 Uncharacterised protein [Bifidobacterium adolescentis]